LLLVLKSLALAFSALLPVVNPLGSALLFLGVVGDVPQDEFRRLARKVAISMVMFLLIIELAGAALLAFFGISLPVVQLAGGLVLATMGWQLLNESDSQKQAPVQGADRGPIEEKIFYPLTFPLTAGPGCIVVTATLSAHAARHDASENVLDHVGIALAIAIMGLSVWLCYAYAPKITRKIAPRTVHGILRVIAFVLLCIGVQIAWNGLEAMVKAMSK
jgi:multiple antibiotic resistance protein